MSGPSYGSQRQTEQTASSFSTDRPGAAANGGVGPGHEGCAGRCCNAEVPPGKESPFGKASQAESKSKHEKAHHGDYGKSAADGTRSDSQSRDAGARESASNAGTTTDTSASRGSTGGRTGATTSENVSQQRSPGDGSSARHTHGSDGRGAAGSEARATFSKFSASNASGPRMNNSTDGAKQSSTARESASRDSSSTFSGDQARSTRAESQRTIPDPTSSSRATFVGVHNAKLQASRGVEGSAATTPHDKVIESPRATVTTESAFAKLHPKASPTLEGRSNIASVPHPAERIIQERYAARAKDVILDPERKSISTPSRDAKSIQPVVGSDTSCSAMAKSSDEMTVFFRRISSFERSAPAEREAKVNGTRHTVSARKESGDDSFAKSDLRPSKSAGSVPAKVNTRGEASTTPPSGQEGSISKPSQSGPSSTEGAPHRASSPTETAVSVTRNVVPEVRGGSSITPVSNTSHSPSTPIGDRTLAVTTPSNNRPVVSESTRSNVNPRQGQPPLRDVATKHSQGGLGSRASSQQVAAAKTSTRALGQNTAAVEISRSSIQPKSLALQTANRIPGRMETRERASAISRNERRESSGESHSQRQSVSKNSLSARRDDSAGLVSHRARDGRITSVGRRSETLEVANAASLRNQSRVRSADTKPRGSQSQQQNLPLEDLRRKLEELEELLLDYAVKTSRPGRASTRELLRRAKKLRFAKAEKALESRERKSKVNVSDAEREDSSSTAKGTKGSAGKSAPHSKVKAASQTPTKSLNTVLAKTDDDSDEDEIGSASAEP